MTSVKITAGRTLEGRYKRGYAWLSPFDLKDLVVAGRALKACAEDQRYETLIVRCCSNRLAGSFIGLCD